MRSLILLLVLSCAPLRAEIVVRDEGGRTLRLDRPAQRIVSLSPHITENLFAIGAGERVVGTVEFSNYPEAAKRIPLIGGYEKIDLEAVAALRPDLVLAWESGNIASHVARLRAIGLNVAVTEARRIEDVPADLERLGALTGLEASRAVAARFRERLAALRAGHAGRPFLVWIKCLMLLLPCQRLWPGRCVTRWGHVYAGMRRLRRSHGE